MQFSVVVVLACLAIVAEGFRLPISRTFTRNIQRLNADPLEESVETSTTEQTVKDLDLEQMFEVFEEADKSVAAPATTFTPSAARFDPSKKVGSSGPFGFFDPARLTLDISEADFDVYQEAEVKHGRLAMLAFVGINVAEIFHPLFNGEVTGPAIFHFQQCETMMPLFPVWATWAIAMIEGQTIISVWQTPDETFKQATGVAKLKKNHIPGDLSFDPFNLKPKDTAAFNSMRTKELNNGRLAMIGTAGVVVQELITGSAIFSS